MADASLAKGCWATLSRDTLARIIQLAAFNENDVACSLLPLDKATCALARSLGYSATVHAAKAVPRWAFAARWGAPGAMRDMTLEMRRKLLCATAASGDLENLELAASVVGCPLGPDVFTAARAAGHGEVLGWLRSAGLTDTDASLEAAGRAGHPNCSPSCIIAAAGAGHSVCGRLRSINSLEERMNIALAAAAAAAGGGHAAECDRLLQLHKEMRDGFLGLHPAVPAFEAENFPQLQAAGVRLLEAAVEGLGLGELAALYGRWIDRSRTAGRPNAVGGGDGSAAGAGAEAGAGAAAGGGDGGSSSGSGQGYQHSGWVLTWRPEEEEEDALFGEARTPQERSAAAAWRAGVHARLLAAAACSASPEWRAKYEWLKARGHVARRDCDKVRVAARAAACPSSVPGPGLEEEAVVRLGYLRGELGVAAVCSARVVAEALVSGNDRALEYVLRLAAEAADLDSIETALATEAATGSAAQAGDTDALGSGPHAADHSQSFKAADSHPCSDGGSSSNSNSNSSSSSSRPCPSPHELVAAVVAAPDAVPTAAARGHIRCLKALRAWGGRMSTAVLVAAARAGQMQVVAWLLDECCTGRAAPGGRGRVVGAEGSSGSGGGEPQGEGEVQQTAEVCTAAARSGSLELLALVRARGCPWGPEAVAAGAAAGCEAVLAYLVAQGCPAGDCHDAYAAAIAAEDLLTLRCLRRLGLPWSGDAATWRAHAIRCGVPLLRWLHEEAQVPVLDWMRSLGNRRDGRRTEQLSRRVTEWYAGEEAKAAEVRRQRLRQDEEEMQRLQGKKWWRRAAVPSESPKTPSGSGPQQRSLESTAQLARDTGNHHVLRWVSERIALANIWRIGR
ncbi:hypothetical protein CHLRE_10g449400v5 [Chlamydomonas reinhardtii]|uniref:Uncharacterized protein n=1 Tax=Chlamydomonas reinhardtii TaxID=3055 RepID=A0A2K3DB22_CHLRE|nr:uncharacterized protein CHLRE_10g449400v5 [Chlamydomonas reinhardtii]PNW77736.1 hypothetical protein CHLRE_10g449400v5 [Chlamydomonas reinhardtii]